MLVFGSARDIEIELERDISQKVGRANGRVPLFRYGALSHIPKNTPEIHQKYIKTHQNTLKYNKNTTKIHQKIPKNIKKHMKTPQIIKN